MALKMPDQETAIMVLTLPILGTFLNYVPHSYALLDTEVRSEDLKQNLIIIGGPIVNKITEQINDYFKIRFVHDKAWSIYSNNFRQKIL